MSDNNIKKEEEELTVSEIVDGTLGDARYSEVMSENFLLYAVSTLLDRALPQIDGLLPVQRRVLLAMKRSNVNSKGPYKKSATIVGETMGKYHPHGDASIYGALARMAQDFSLRVPLIDGQGAFGSIDGDSPAAMRYTEARMSPSAEEIVADMHDKILPDYMGRNFDESETEPSIMPTRFPNLLINGSYGIATGMTAFFLPHNPSEAISLCVWRLNNPEGTIKQAIKRISGPDFPTGGSVVNNQGLNDLYETGKGKITGLAKAHIEKGDKGKDKIVITELPWMVQKGGDSGILKRIGTQYAEGKYPEFESLNDFSAESIRIEIGLKRNVNASSVLQKLLKNTALRKTYGSEMNCVIKGRPKRVSLLELVDNYLEFRKYVVVKRAEKRISEIETRLHKLDAYMKVIGATDKVVQIIKKSKDRQAAKPPLKKLLKIDEGQAQLIVEMQLGSLTQLDSYKIKQEVKELKSELKHLQKFVKTPSMVVEEIVEEFGKVKDSWKKQGLLERRTTLIDVSSDSAEDDVYEEMFTSTEPAESCMLMISKEGKALAGLGNLKRGGSLKLSESDSLEVLAEASTNDEFLIISDKMQAYRLRLAELESSSRKTTGDRLSTIIGIGKDDKVIAAIPLRQADPNDKNNKIIEANLKQDIVFVTEQGMIKRTELSEFARANSAGIAAGNLKGNDKLAAAIINPDGDNSEILMLCNNGKILRISSSASRVMGRAAGGVKGMKVPENSVIVSADLIDSADDTYLLIHETGLAKRFPLAQINQKGRGGQGVGVGKVDSKFGNPVFGKSINSKDKDIIAVSAENSGKPIEIPQKSIPEGKINTTAKEWKYSTVKKVL